MMKRNPAERGLGLAKVGATFSLTGTAVLTVQTNVSGPVGIRTQVADGLPPRFLELSGDRKLMDAASHSGRVRLEMIGLKFDTQVAAQMQESGLILVEAHPLFLEMANNLEARHCD